MSTENRLQTLYDSEINATIAWLWDEGFAWYLGDNINGFVETGTGRDFAKAVEGLCSAAIVHYPNSDFARLHADDAPMTTSQEGVDFIKRREGLETKAYQDIAGVWTIGYGQTGENVRPGLVVTEEQAEDMLVRALAEREDKLNRWCEKHNVELQQQEFDALMSFIYNVGFAGFRRSTAARRLVQGGSRGHAADALLWWNKSRVNGVLREVLGLTNRRRAERELFMSTPSEGCVEEPGATASAA